MKIKLYLKDWMYNCGLVGFLRILKHNEDNFALMKENYLEFDSENLRCFSEYYFKYFFDKNNIAQKLKERTNSSFEYLENYMEIENDKVIKEKIKSTKKYIKDSIKREMDKIKKIDETIYNNIKVQYDNIDKEITVQGIRDIREIIFQNIEIEFINKKISLNSFKSKLSNTYFGQVSFLNVVKNSLSYEEQQDLMYKDYVSNIVEMGFIYDILNNKYTKDEIYEYITNIDNKLLSDKIQKIYTDIRKKYLDKEKNVEEIQEYIRKNVISECHMCENNYALTTNYTEGNFIPLALSSENMKNFFWNQNAKFPICDICKLILFCTPAGTTSIKKAIKDKGNYVEKDILSFVNYDTSLDKLLKTNNSFGANSKSDIKLSNPYTELILNIVEQNKEISRWQLQNIFVVEFESEYGSFSRLEYFNIPRYVLNFFEKYANKTLNTITDYKYKLQIMDYILKNKDIKYVINERLYDELKKENKNGYNTFLAIQTRQLLNMLKKEKIEVSDINKNNDKLYVLYNLGIKIHEKLKDKNKLNGYTYKMLNNIKSGNKKEFMDTVIRIHMSMEMDVSPIFLKIMQDTELDFESIGYSFLSGLISNKYEKNSIGGKIDE